MRAAAIAALGMVGLIALAGCKGRREPAGGSPGSGSGSGAAPAGDAAVADANLDVCRAAASHARSLAPDRRAQALLDGCQPCGDWQPLLTWNTLASAGGPSRAAIEAALLACHAFCTAAAKQRFLNTLDAARGQSTRGPWRWLGDMCKAEVSAVPDSRFMGAPYFALDRIARTLGAIGALGDPPLEVPLPALGINGVGVELPEVDAAADAAATAVAVDAGAAVLTVDAAQVRLGALPVARMSATGLGVSGDYPGPAVEPGKLAAVLAAPALAGHPVLLLAPRALPAARLAAVVAAAGGHELRLAVAAPNPGGWILPAALPIALIARGAPRRPKIAGDGIHLLLANNIDALVHAASAADLVRGTPLITVRPEATTEGLAAVLAALAARHAPAATLDAGKP
jgi:hypothetical protein